MQLLRAGFKPIFDINFYQTNWTLTEKCNFNCTYCANQHKRKNGTSLARDTMLRTLDNLRYTNKERYFFALEGGEPTLYEHLDEMLEYIARYFSDKKNTIRIVTNGSASAKKMQELLTICANSNIMFIITLHFESGLVDNIMEKLSTFDAATLKHFLVKVLIAPGKMREGVDAIKKLRAINFANYRVLHVLDFETGVIDPRYRQDELVAIDALRQECNATEYFILFNEYALPDGGKKTDTFTYTEGIQHGLLNYSGMFCAAGVCSIKINADGSFSKTGFCGESTYALHEGNPFADPVFTKPMRCPQVHCTCSAYAKLAKWQDNDNAPQWFRHEVQHG
jgi:organic radical activating enzyme